MTAGIGAAMRIAPVALYFGDDPEALFDSVMAASLMTHRDIRSLSGALAVAHAVRRLVAGEPRDPSLLLWVAADVARDESRIAARVRRHGHLARPARHGASRGPSPTPSRCSTCPASVPWPPWSTRPTATAPSPSASARPWASRPPASPPASTSC